MKKIISIISLLIILISILHTNSIYADTLDTIVIYNDNLWDSTWSDYNNEHATSNASSVIILRTKTNYWSWETLTIDLSNLVWSSWSISWTPASKLATYTWDPSNAISILPAPNSVSWTTPSNNFEDNVSASDQCSLSWSDITCNVPAWETILKYTWIMISGLDITNETLTWVWNTDSASIVDINIWWTVSDSWIFRVAIVRTGQSWETDWDAWWSVALDVEILSSISITVEQPGNLVIAPAAWNSDRAYSTGTVTVTTNVIGGYSVYVVNDWTWNTLRNIVDESIQISELSTSWVTWAVALQDNWFWICSNDTDWQACNFTSDMYYWVWASWHEFYSDTIDDTTTEVTYHVDVDGSQEAWTYQGVVTYLAAINL